jgi:hypothetical protein
MKILGHSQQDPKYFTNLLLLQMMGSAYTYMQRILPMELMKPKHNTAIADLIIMATIWYKKSRLANKNEIKSFLDQYFTFPHQPRVT